MNPLVDSIPQRFDVIFPPPDVMAPIWPFKKNKETLDRLPEEAPPKVVYALGEDPFSRDSSQSVDQQAYKDALALFGDGSTNVVASENTGDQYEGVVNQTPQQTSDAKHAESSTQSNQSIKESAESNSKYLHHTDGYYYKEKDGGGYESTPYTKNENGEYVAYR